MLAVDESSWMKEYETERLAKIERRQEIYIVSRIRPSRDLDS